jgi:hypothetical protein
MSLASSLNFAARELCWAADVERSAGPSAANAEADRACMRVQVASVCLSF